MKVSKRDINLVIILLGLIAVALSYFLGVKKLKDRTDQLKAENTSLLGEVQVLEEIAMKQSDYVTHTESMKAVGDVLISVFPAAVYAEDQILYADKLENMFGCYFGYLSTPSTTYLDIPMPERENNLASLSDITGAIAAHSTVNQAEMLDATGMLVGCSSSSNVFACTYDQLKELITYITTDNVVKSIEDITLTYDSTTGNLAGSMTINYYSLTGTGTSYSMPPTTVTGHGVDCIFGSLTGEPEESALFDENEWIQVDEEE